jgi:DMSO/TMAO reductase YedYZ heme-binding membrane subunit
MAETHRRVRARFWMESALAALTGGLFALTLFWHDWLEALGVDPDNHNGTAERLIVAALLVLCLVFAMTARLEWRRTALAG